MNIQLRFLSIMILMMGVVCLAFAQEAADKPGLFDTYGSVNEEDASARLDNFAVLLQNNPDAQGFIICYGPEGKGAGSGRAIAENQRNYLVNPYRIDGGRIQTIYAGRYKDPTEVHTELWIVPAGSEPPKPKRFKTKPKKVNGKFAELRTWDENYESYGFDEFESFGPSVGTSKIAAFADVLREQPKSVGYIVAFNCPKGAPGGWRRVAQRAVDSWIGQDAIASDRIRILYGGIFEEGKKAQPNEDIDNGGEESPPIEVLLQLWVLPKDTPPPIEENKRETTPEQAVQIGAYLSHFLRYKHEAQRAFDGFADVLRADEQLNVCLIVFPDLDSGEPIERPIEPPPINTAQLVENWKTELVEKGGIPERRIIIVHAAPREFKHGLIEVWAVPQGAALPDPYKPVPGEIEEEPQDAPE